MDVIADSRCRIGIFLNFESLKSHDYPTHPKNPSTKTTQVYIGFVHSMIRGKKASSAFSYSTGFLMFFMSERTSFL